MLAQIYPAAHAELHCRCWIGGAALQTDPDDISCALFGSQNAFTLIAPAWSRCVIAMLKQVLVQTFNIDRSEKGCKAGDKMFGGPCSRPGFQWWSGLQRIKP